MKWGKILRFALIPVVLLGIPIFLSSDGFLTWLYEKSFTDQWSSAPTITYKCAGYFRWTFRDERAVQVYDVYKSRWPQDGSIADAIYYQACSLRDIGVDLELKAGGNSELRARRDDVRSRAADLFEEFAARFSSDSRAEVARRAAAAIREGH